ncbi:hypothetical protein A2U01_0108909, partial [Trifolium medium]|nr:hypothetical protein [Trifolium medium]
AISQAMWDFFISLITGSNEAPNGWSARGGK